MYLPIKWTAKPDFSNFRIRTNCKRDDDESEVALQNWIWCCCCDWMDCVARGDDEHEKLWRQRQSLVAYSVQAPDLVSLPLQEQFQLVDFPAWLAPTW